MARIGISVPKLTAPPMKRCDSSPRSKPSSQASATIATGKRFVDGGLGAGVFPLFENFPQPFQARGVRGIGSVEEKLQEAAQAHAPLGWRCRLAKE